ncbi:MAG TPA: FtsX-like permease family protein, partial [Saprospiraceae bacterium]|nr:FtsX-like permease family protein [Saprospiraceae bacterium]
GQIVSTMSRIEKIWKDLVPDQAFQYSFIDDSIDRQYRSERRLGQIVSLATLLALFIACLGLFGIATLTTAQRMKEIGVRKVLGASTGEILVLLNKPLTLIILLATGIAIPVAWYLMQNWLTNFAFRINPSILVMLGAGLGALLLALVAVSWQSFNAARKSPVHSLRNE